VIKIDGLTMQGMSKKNKTLHRKLYLNNMNPESSKWEKIVKVSFLPGQIHCQSPGICQGIKQNVLYPC
jgi:hypothetical protein